MLAGHIEVTPSFGETMAKAVSSATLVNLVVNLYYWEETKVEICARTEAVGRVEVAKF